VTAALLTAAIALAPAANAQTKLEGEYQLMMQLRKDLRAFPWDFDSNDGAVSNPLQLWVFSQPRTGTEAFVKSEAVWRSGDNGNERPEFQFREAHARFFRSGPLLGFDARLFSRQRRFWVDNYLVKFVDDREATGVRLDLWSPMTPNLTLIAGDQSNQLDPSNLISNYAGSAMPREFVPVDSLVDQAKMRTDDMYVMRMRQEFFQDRRLRLGVTWNRTEGWAGRDSVSDRQPWNSVWGFDSRYRWRDTDIAFEYGFSRREFGDVPDPELSFFRKSTGISLPDRAVFQGEIRSIRFGSTRWGHIGVTPGWWSRGPLYANSLGGPNSDEKGFNIQTYYLLPERAITYTNQFSSYGQVLNARRRRVTEIYNELYIEFVNGFTGKTAYRRRDEFERDRRVPLRDAYLSWTNELQVESRLAYLRVQSKLQNIGRADGKQLFVIEDRINLSDRTKIYNRFALGNDPSRLRKGVFTQLQYRPTDRMEMYLQYGPGDIGGGSNPVEDGNLTGSGDQYDELKFILKGSF
jgi:hypothetical protein